MDWESFKSLLVTLISVYFVSSFAVAIFYQGFEIAAVINVLLVFNQILMGLYGMNSYFLMYCALRYPKTEETPQEPDEEDWPHVTVQLPIYNERFVIERLIRAAVQIEYPADKLEIQVLDDSNDGTSEIVRRVLAELSTKTKVKLSYVTRKSRKSYKAGALVIGTAQARGEYLAIFDADFVPNSDFLRKTIPHFADPKVGCVQCRWGHLNFDHSLFTKLQAIGHDGHFIIEQHAKTNNNIFLNFNGTGGVWRRDCIVSAGDWSGDTLAEDLDLSYRAQLKGWRIKYLRDVEVPAEIPLSISAFKKQQARWAKGSMQTALKIIGRIWDSSLQNWQKWQATVHLFGYAVHPLMVVNLALTMCMFYLNPNSDAGILVWVTVIIAAGPPMIVMLSQGYLGHIENAIYMPMLIILHHGLCLNNAAACLEAIQGKTSGFERTPKFGDMQLGSKWYNTEYAKALKNTKLPWGEILMAAFLIFSMIMGLFVEVNYYTYPWLMFFTGGFLMVIKLHFDEIEGMRKMMGPSADVGKKGVKSQ